jgi:glycosyltransferase involved in cell wall biosynthesis
VRSSEGRLSALRAKLRRRVWRPTSAALYRAARRHLSWWPLSLGAARQPPISPAPRIAYYYHSFPVLSETFIQREVSALREAGVSVDVFAHEVLRSELFDASARRLMETTTYLPAFSTRPLPRAARRLAVRHPLKTANILLYVLFRQHAPYKDSTRDRQFFKRAVALAAVVQERGITHVHCPWANSDATVAQLAARLAGVRYTLQARASDIHRGVAVYGRQQRLVGAAFVITNTRYNETILRALLPATGAPPVHVIHNGIDVDRFHPPPRRIAGSGHRILTVGRLVEPKGLEYLLHACRILRDEGAAISCEIVGGRSPHEVNYYLRLKKLRRALGLESVVHMLGAQPFDRVQARYEHADVFVLPAVHARDGRREITPNVLIEAMAMQLPVISTTVGGIPEIVEDGVSGILVPPGDERALADAIRRVLGDAVLRERLGRKARRRIEERFDIRKNIRSYVELFATRRS